MSPRSMIIRSDTMSFTSNGFFGSHPVAATVVLPPDTAIGPRLNIRSIGMMPDLPRLWLRNSAVCTVPHFQCSKFSPRLVMVEKLKERNFTVVDLDTIDAKLNELGITEGGQLPTVTAEELARTIQCDSLLYGNILDAQRLMLGIYFNKKVQIEFKIISASGATMWEDERKSEESKLVIDPTEMLKTAGEELLIEAGSDVIMKALNSHPLIKHLRNVCTWSASTLP